MSSSRAGANAGSNRVSFTKASAERIANAVREVESGNRDGVPFVSSPRGLGGSGAKIKSGTFDGSWDIGQTKTVKFCGTTNTAEVLNLTVHIDAGSGTGTSTQTVLFASACGTNVALELPIDQCKNIGGAINKIAGFSSGEIQILGHDDSGCLNWYSITTCSTATATP